MFSFSIFNSWPIIVVSLISFSMLQLCGHKQSAICLSSIPEEKHILLRFHCVILLPVDYVPPCRSVFPANESVHVFIRLFGSLQTDLAC